MTALFTAEGDLTAAPSELRALGAAIGKVDGPTTDGSMFNRVMEITKLPSTNPKRAFGARKPSAQFIPPVAILEESAVMALGAAKYGAFNWQDEPIDATTYYSAAIRHLLQWFSGEDVDQESGASHLAHVRACMAILLDAQASGRLVDDRPECASASEAIERLKVTA
ncbi:dATP/dGTP diphosphohydrolase domain-containing protein [Rhizobium leucaenae]|uniref:dATP/dGTP diphosphohydrolase domain-containing protein n=1 Tax=Rhizobium leucaenae TaxID=29450 RepID=UPI0003FA4763|nr:dATP/dGTP diphosphohydrolase domain-containing protein [Rhizobium leucaenae]